MLTTFDIDNIMYRVLIADSASWSLTGWIYHDGQRPANSAKEDVIINHISLTTGYVPQTAISNVNIYVPDKTYNISGVVTPMPDTERLHALADKVMSTLRAASILGIKITPTSQTVVAEPSIHQHYVNIRVEWNIQRID